MKRLRICASAIATAAISLAALAGSNQPTTPCGNLDASGSGHAAAGARCTVTFSFSPAACQAAACTCNQVAYLQIIRARDVDRNEYIQPFEQQELRMILGETAPQLNGWALDRSANQNWGYFGGINGDPLKFRKAKMDAGTNASPVKPAVMKDRPERWKDNVQFEAVSVPVCVDETGACSSKLLGFQHWSFEVHGGSGTNPVDRPATEWEREAVMKAIDKWNETKLPAMQSLPTGQTLN
jgi:hypothetical protein